MDKIGVGVWEPTERERELVQRVLDSGRISYGPLSREFEQRMATLHQRRFGVLSNSGTSSLLVALEALKIKYGWQPGSEVVVPAVTFVATVNVVLQAGLVPVLADIEHTSYGMSADSLIAAITDKTVAVIPVHLFGQPCADIEVICWIAKDRGLAVIEDSCECMFAEHNGKKVGSFGHIACFSTYVAHLVTTGVGGVSVTDDADLAALMRSLVNHGRDGIYISIDDDNVIGERLTEVVSRRFKFQHVGHSFRVTEFEAALGVAQLESWEEMIAKRQANAEQLTAELSALHEDIVLPQTWKSSTHSWMMYPIMTKRAADKWRLIEHLEQQGVETREMLPLTNQPVYAYIFNEDDYPCAKVVNDCGFYVGCHQGLDSRDIHKIAVAIGDYFAV